MLRAFEMIAVGLTLITVGGCASTKSMARSSDPPDTKKSAVAGIGRSRTGTKQSDARTQRQPSAALIASELEQGYRAERAGKPAEAKLAYERVLKYAPDHARAHHRLAIIADNARQFPEAEQHYLAALRKESQNSDLLSDLGYSYQLQKRDNDSERVLREALTYNPKHRKALYNLGVLQANRGQYDEALASFQTVGTEAEARKLLEKYFPDGPPKTSGAGEQLAETSPRNPFLPGKSAASGDARAQQLMADLENETAEPAMDSSKGVARTAWGDDLPGTANVSANPKMTDLGEANPNATNAGIASLGGESPDSAADSAENNEETDAGPLVASFDRPAVKNAGGALVDPAVQAAGGTTSADSAVIVNAGGTAADWEQARVQAAQIGLGAGTSLPLLLTSPQEEASLAQARRPAQNAWSTATGVANIDSLPSEFPTTQQPFVRSR